ncbi:MAG: bifunctional cytidylyltransferase/SDR family oxidoreductase [Puniceicoccales bacterium]|jgi:2-C-methyl-D-erythritol 4-phosphate cytidylyltransferase|nr:bifunctional cytidylyltransferase/SDR family oxidoreductase [Puniceicoccales bacterium]
MKTYAILLASGIGERIGNDLPKQFLKISGRTILEHSIGVFERNGSIDEIIVVVHGQFVDFCKKILAQNDFKKISKILVGGKTRQKSSFIGVSSIVDGEAKVLIHDAVRPLISDQIINNCIAALDQYDAVDVAIPTADTIIVVNDDMIIEDIPPRQFFMRGQTPQAFKLGIIKHAHSLAEKSSNLKFTDDCGLVKMFNLAPIHVIGGEEGNIKITYPIDLFIADRLFQVKHLPSHGANLTQLKNKVLVIFGSSYGIGKAIADLAQQYEAKTYGFSRTNGVDVRNMSSVQRALEMVYSREKCINFIVNTTGILKLGNLNDKPISEIRDEVETNYFGCINIARSSYDYLKQSKGALLFFTSSSHTRGRASYSIYSSTKAAIVNFAQALAEEWISDGIRINIMSPARTSTPMRLSNFGKEPPETLLSPEFVAEKSLHTLLQNYTGQVIDIRQSQGNSHIDPVSVP